MELEDLVKEVYARFGLTYYCAEVLHTQLCLIYALACYEDKLGITKPRIQEKIKYAASLTLGILIKEVLSLVPNNLHDELAEAVEKRNYLAHHFWFEKIHLFFSKDGVTKMILELDGYRNCFQKIDAKLSETFKDRFSRLGITQDLIDRSTQSILSGKPTSPLPNKRKLKKREKIIAIWELSLQNNIGKLFFQTEDKELWQLCDVGFGWSTYEDVQPEWRKNDKVDQFLPAEINPRPEIKEFWNYEFVLKGAVLWVKKDPIDQDFKWGVRLKD